MMASLNIGKNDLAIVILNVAMSHLYQPSSFHSDSSRLINHIIWVVWYTF